MPNVLCLLPQIIWTGIYKKRERYLPLLYLRREATKSCGKNLEREHLWWLSLKCSQGVPGWWSRLIVQLLISALLIISRSRYSALVRISGSWDWALHGVLTQWGIYLGFSLSVCFCPPSCPFSLSPSKIKINNNSL